MIRGAKVFRAAYTLLFPSSILLHVWENFWNGYYSNQNIFCLLAIEIQTIQLLGILGHPFQKLSHTHIIEYYFEKEVPICCSKGNLITLIGIATYKGHGSFQTRIKMALLHKLYTTRRSHISKDSNNHC